MSKYLDLAIAALHVMAAFVLFFVCIVLGSWLVLLFEIGVGE